MDYRGEMMVVVHYMDVLQVYCAGPKPDGSDGIKEGVARLVSAPEVVGRLRLAARSGDAG